MVTVSEAFDGGDVTAISLGCEGQTGEPRLAVDQHRTAATSTHVTTPFRTEAAGFVSQDIEQNGVALDGQFLLGTIDDSAPRHLSGGRKHREPMLDHTAQPIRIDLLRFGLSPSDSFKIVTDLRQNRFLGLLKVPAEGRARDSHLFCKLFDGDFLIVLVIPSFDSEPQYFLLPLGQ